MKKILLIVVPILVLAGAFVGLAVAGVIKVPGLTPRKPKPSAMYGEPKTKVEKEVPAEPVVEAQVKATPKAAPKKAVEESKTDPAKGAKKVAQLWNNLPAEKLAQVVKEYKDSDLAPILVAMDPEKVAELLVTLEPKRSAQLSKELQTVASVVPKPEG